MSHHGPPGSQGPRKLQVMTNSYKITGFPKKSYNQYDAFDHERIATDKVARRRIEVFERLQNHTAPSVFSPKIIYDGDKIAYSSYPLSFGNSATYEVNMSDRAPRQDGRGIIRVTLKRVDAPPITFEDLQNLVDGRTRQLSPRAVVALNLVQLIVRQGPNLKYPNNVKTFFCREAGSRVLGGGLEVLKGFYQSVRPALRQLLVNVDTSCGVFYQSGPMLEVAMNFLGSRNPRALYIEDGRPELSKLRKFFKGVMITFKHRQGVRKKIESIVPHAGLQKFEWNKDKSDGIAQSTTVQAYFREAYNLTLIYPDAIGVRVGGGNIVPIELCFVLPDQRFKNRLPAELTKPMVDFTSEKPQARLDAIRRSMGAGVALDYSSSPWVREAEMVVTSSPAIIDGKVLSPPPMQYDAGTVRPDRGAWNAVNQRFKEPKRIRSWAVVDYSPNSSRDQHANQRFVDMIQHNCNNLGMSMPPPQSYVRGSGSNPSQDLYRAAKEAAGQNGAPPDLILVILPPSAPEIRLQVKRFGDVKEGIVTQCVRVDKVSGARDQYCNNVAMKINAKLGGVNAIPDSTILQKLRKKPFIIMGIDVGHPAPGVHDQPSVASLVASYDLEAMKYNAYATVQPPRMEHIEKLGFLVLAAINDFGELHGAAPERLVIYRDGLSEGEYVGVAQQEIQDVKWAIDEVWKRRNLKLAKPKLTFVVVGKRHHVRFFPRDQRDADRSGNCPAGFVADQGIGNPIAKDFYLQSHAGLLGTSRPSHYVVIHDEIFGEDVQVLQELSFVLCHSYARATRSVSIPAPVYYADLVCGRANFHFDPDLKFDDSSASVSSGNQTSFNIEQWRAGFSRPHKNMWGKMFFM